MRTNEDYKQAMGRRKVGRIRMHIHGGDVLSHHP